MRRSGAQCAFQFVPKLLGLKSGSYIPVKDASGKPVKSSTFSPDMSSYFQSKAVFLKSLMNLKLEVHGKNTHEQNDTHKWPVQL